VHAQAAAARFNASSIASIHALLGVGETEAIGDDIEDLALRRPLGLHAREAARASTVLAARRVFGRQFDREVKTSRGSAAAAARRCRSARSSPPCRGDRERGSGDRRAGGAREESFR